MPKILVFGTGSVGAVYAYILCKANGDSSVTTICRSNYDQVSANGLIIHSDIFGQDLNCRPNVARSVSDAAQTDTSQAPFDFVVMTAKALPSTPSIASLIQPAVTPEHTGIVLIQNGIAIEEPYAALYPANPILSCVTYLPVTQVSSGVFRHTEVERLLLGTYPSKAPPAHKTAAETFASFITRGGATAELHGDVQSKRWAKLLVNAAWNPICALSRSSDAHFLAASPSYAVQFVEAVMLEISAIATAAGYPEVSKETVDWQMGRAKVRKLPGIEPSMLADARKGARLEVDAIVGNTVRIAKEKGVDCPLLKGVLALVRALDESFAREGGMNT